MNHDIFLSHFEEHRLLTLLFIPVFTLFAVLSPAQVEVNFSDATGDPGEEVEVDVTVNDFQNIISMQYSVNWNPEVIEFDTFSNVSPVLAGPNVLASPNEIGEDYAMTLSWFTDDFENGTDLPDGSVLFTIEFVVVGEMCDESAVTISEDPRAIEFIQVQGNEDVEIDVVSDPGLVNVPGNDCDGSGDLQLIGSMETVEPGEEVCVQISVEHFDSILSMQYAHTWDSDVLEFIEVRNTNLEGLSPGLFNVNMSTGALRLTWNDPNAEGISVPDGTVIYELCFNAVGSLGEMSQVPFTGDGPLFDIEVIKSEGTGETSVDPVITDGKVTIEGQFEGPIIAAQSGSASTGDEFCMDITVQNFDSIEGVTFSLAWDETALEFLNLDNFNDDLNIGPGNFNINDAGNGVLAFLWTSSDGLPKDLPDGTVLFSVCYEITGDCDQAVDVTFTDNPTVKEVISGEDVVPAQFLGGQIEIPCFSVPFEVTDVNCNGDCDGAIDLMPAGGQEPIDYDWNMNGLDGTEDPQNLCAGTYSVTITEAGGTFIEITIDVEEPDPLEIVIESVGEDDGSVNGSIDLSLNGGTPPYGTSWSGPTSIADDTVDPADLASGSYTVTVTDDNGCTATRDIFVPGQFNPTGNVTDACFGECTGAIDITVNGGTPEYDFFWDGPTDIEDGTEDPTGLCPGDYDLTVEDSEGNTTIGSFTVQESDEIIITVDDVQADEDGMGSGSIAVSVSGGAGGFDYSWSGPSSIPDGTEDPNGLLAGTYTLIVTDSDGCTASTDIIVDPPFSIVSADVSHITCAGRQDGAIDITVAGGEDPYTYAWSNGSTSEDINTLSAGTYSVTVTDNTGSTITASYTITEPEPLVVNDIEIIRGSTQGGQNGSARAMVSGGTRPYSYEWSSSNETDSVADMLSAGLNILIVTDARGCSVMDSVDIPISEIPIDCYEGRKVITPNGDNLNDRFIIECINEHPNTLSIYNRVGQLVFEQDNYDNSWEGTDDGGSEVDEDTYLWVLEVTLPNGVTKVYKGAITVVRNLH